MASDKNFVLFRRFGELHARLLLYRQDELAEMEQNLKDMDHNERTPYHLSSRRGDHNLARTRLVLDIQDKLSQGISWKRGYLTGYGTDDALETYYRQVERPQPKSRNVESLSRWLEGNKPLSMSESSFLDDWDDLTGPDHETDQGGLDAIAASFGAILHGWGLPRVLTNNYDLKKTTDSHIIILSPSRVALLSRCLTTLLAIVFLSAPITVLHGIKSTPSGLWLLTLFTAGFSLVLSLFARCRNFEVFSATAAYCAVMVVFVSNIV